MTTTAPTLSTAETNFWIERATLELGSAPSRNELHLYILLRHYKGQRAPMLRELGLSEADMIAGDAWVEAASEMFLKDFETATPAPYSASLH